MLPAAPLHRARLLLAGLWAGSAVAIAITATTLNSVMTDRAEFGRTVSDLFKTEALIALACTAIIHVLAGLDRTLDARAKRTMFILTFVGLLAVLGYFFVQPMMAELRASASTAAGMAPEAKRLFGMLHGVTLVAYLVQAVAAVMLVVKNR